MTEETVSPEQYYISQQELVSGELAILQKGYNNIGSLRLVTILLLGVAVYFIFQQADTLPVASAVGLAGFFIFLMVRQGAIKTKMERYELHHTLLGNERKALAGDLSAFDGGDKYINPLHPFSYDLDIFGQRSIYNLLNRTVTNKGADVLAGYLQSPYAGKAGISKRQAAIQELGAMPEFVTQFRITGTLHKEEPHAEQKIGQWLEIEDAFINNSIMKVLVYLVPVLSLAFAIWAIVSGSLNAGLILMLVVNWSVNIKYSKQFKASHYLLSESVKLVGKTEQLLLHITGQRFTSDALAQLNREADATVAAIKELKKLAHLFDNRQNGMVGPLLNSLFLFDVNCMLRLERWKAQHKPRLTQAINVVAEMDAYNSYATYAFNTPGNRYADINEQATAIRGTDVRHPLILNKTAIGNDLSLGEHDRLYILTGANMTGKSTFIRTVGTNIILGYLGLPVPAASFTIPLLRIYTSIRVTDSVQDDVSYFKAELQRMQALMLEVKSAGVPYLVLLDEPLRGTNSTDKLAGTRSIVQKLLSFDAIGIVATHDIALCTMAAEHEGLISNYHFESRITDGEICFDHKLKTGPSRSNNATLLMHMMGIID